MNNSEESEAPSDEISKPLEADEMETLQSKHGYKTTFMRDESGKLLFEIYIPIEEKKGKQKLEEHTNLNRKPKNYKEYREQEQHLLKAEQPKRSKVFLQTLADDFETDESMKLLNKSDLGSNNDDEIDSKSISDVSSPVKSKLKSQKTKKKEVLDKQKLKSKKNYKQKLGEKSLKLAHVMRS